MGKQKGSTPRGIPTVPDLQTGDPFALCLQRNPCGFRRPTDAVRYDCVEVEPVHALAHHQR